MKIIKALVFVVVCIIFLLISGKISKSLAYGLAHNNDFNECTYTQRSSIQLESFHAGETGKLKKHACEN